MLQNLWVVSKLRHPGAHKDGIVLSWAVGCFQLQIEHVADHTTSSVLANLHQSGAHMLSRAGLLEACMQSL